MNYLKAIFVALFLSSCIYNPKPEDCVVQTITVTDIYEGSTYDIVFRDSGTDKYYINRGLEQGLNIDTLKAKVLNKKATLHLAKVLGGITSEHISQLAVDGNIIFTEFKQNE